MMLTYFSPRSLLVIETLSYFNQKSARRTQALKTIRWDKTKKGKAAEVLTEEYMSSEVSVSEEEAQSSNEEYSRILCIKTLPWYSNMLKEWNSIKPAIRDLASDLFTTTE